MAELISSLLFLIAVLDPIGSVPVYLEATKQLDKAKKRKVAFRSPAIAFAVLFFFIATGQIILEGMDITLSAFQISGGIILFLFALTMVFGEGKPENEKKQIKDYKSVMIFPIAIPSIASPGAIMAVVLLTDNHEFSFQEQATTTVLVIVVIGLTSLLLLAANYVQDKIGEHGISIISKVMGLILAAYAVQSILSGVKEFFKL